MKYFSNNARFVLLYFIFFCTTVHSVSKSPHDESLPLSDYYTQTWSTHDGLPHNGINTISQTSDGYLWVGTWEGLARFNGRDFKIYSRGSDAGLPDSSIKSLTAFSSGKLLVAGARGGLSELHHHQWFPKPSASTMVNHAIYDNENNLWLALEGKGLVLRNPKLLQDTVIINDIRAYKIVQDIDSTIWVGTDKGLFSVINKSIVQHFSTNNGLPDVPVQDLLVTKDNQLIVGTQQGAYKFVDGFFRPLHIKLSQERISSLLEDSTGNIWLGTDNHGIFRLISKQNTIEQFDDKNGLPNNNISSLYQDMEQSIWVGTNSGLFRLREAPFITLTTQQGLQGNYIRSVLSHSDGSLWVGSSKGLNKIQNGKVNTINIADKNTQLSVLSLAETPEKQVLIGTYNQGLYIVENNTLQRVMSIENGLPSNEIRTILIDSSKNLWLGTSSGLVKVSPEKDIELFNIQSGIPANFIMALAEDGNGQVWIGTGNGIASYKNGDIQTYRLNENFDAEYAFGFLIEQNSLWMATDRGLIHIDLITNKMSAVTKENGLPVDKIFQIVIDNNQTFWLTSNRGIISLSRTQVESIIEGKSKTVEFRLFAEGVGLLSSQANGGSTPAATLHKDGSVWIATANGVSHVNQERLQRMSETKIPVVIEQFNADGTFYPLSSEIQLPEGSSRITIHYAGLGYLMAKHIEYQTQLVGFDQNWQNKNSQTFTEFTNLAPGNYTFNMRAKYPNGPWQDTIASVSFSIEPFYWQTTFFKLFILFSSCLLLYTLYRYRMITIERSQIKLQNLVAQQTIELQKQAELFSFQATHDQLTGLYNRRAFDTWCNKDFDQAKKDNQQLTLVILDIDHFKKINDEYSHLIGDQVIQTIANILLKLVKNSASRTKLARWGGEEFTILMKTNQAKAFDFCELVRLTVKNYDFSDIDSRINMTISIGLTDNSEVTEYDKMINRADQALYFAKNNGRNQVRIYQKEDHEHNVKVDKRINQITRSKSRIIDK